MLDLDVAVAPLDIRARVGYMPENDAQIPGMSAVSFVAYCGELSGLPAADAMQRAHEVLYYVGLGEARYRNVETYSTGMKQRIKLAQALVHDPDLLLLDEPTNGMDPKGRDEMLALVRDIAHNKHISLILSSHVMPDVESVCDAVVVMNRGQVVMQGPIASLKKPAGHIFEVRVKGNREAFVERLRAQAYECRETDADVFRVLMPPGAGADQLFSSADGGRRAGAPSEAERADARRRLRRSRGRALDADPSRTLSKARGRRRPARRRVGGHRGQRAALARAEARVSVPDDPRVDSRRRPRRADLGRGECARHVADRHARRSRRGRSATSSTSRSRSCFSSPSTWARA